MLDTEPANHHLHRHNSKVVTVELAVRDPVTETSRKLLFHQVAVTEVNRSNQPEVVMADTEVEVSNHLADTVPLNQSLFLMLLFLSAGTVKKV